MARWRCARFGRTRLIPRQYPPERYAKLLSHGSRAVVTGFTCKSCPLVAPNNHTGEPLCQRGRRETFRADRIDLDFTNSPASPTPEAAAVAPPRVSLSTSPVANGKPWDEGWRNRRRTPASIKDTLICSLRRVSNAELSGYTTSRKRRRRAKMAWCFARWKVSGPG